MTRLLDRWLARAGYNEYMYSGAYAVTTSDPYGRDREGPAAGIVRHARQAYEQNGVVFAAQAVRQALLSEARFVFRSSIDKHLFGNQDLALLEEPWPNGSSGELLARMDLGATQAGNSYIRRAVPADGSGTQLAEMRPDCVTIVTEQVTDETGRTFRRPAGYEEDLQPLGITDREPQFYTADEVAHYSPVPECPGSFKGMSWLTPVLRDVAADQALTQYKTTHVSRGAMPGLVLKYSQRLSPDAIDRLKKRFAAMYAGPDNAGKTLILDEGADAVVAGSTLEQLQYTAVQQAGERRVCAAAGPGMLVILGFEQGDYQAAIRKLADLWARPAWRMCCSSLEHLLPPVPSATHLWYDVADIAALREGELERSQATLVRAQAVGSFVTAGYTRESAVAAAESGDLSQLVPDPRAMPPGIVGRETTTAREILGPGGQVESPAGAQPGVRRPQAGVPQNLPGVVAKNLPNAKPYVPPPMPSMPNGARG